MNRQPSQPYDFFLTPRPSAQVNGTMDYRTLARARQETIDGWKRPVKKP